MSGPRDLQLTLSDGTPLAARLWQPGPEQGPGPWPTLLMRQPYGRAIASTVTYAHPQWYAQQGFAVLVQDVRGRGDSGGTFRGFAQEGADAAATLAWLRQQPWCNGRVGTYGFSYQGLSQLLCDDADQLPEALAPAMAGLDERLHWASEGGCHWWALSLAWGLQLAAQGCRRRGEAPSWQAIRRSLDDGSFLATGLELLAQHDPESMVLGWLRRDPADPEGWRRHTPDPAIWRRPMLLVGGWYDPHLRGVLDLWQRSQAAGGSPWLRIGAWSHLRWNGGIDRLQLRFLEQHLKGGAAPDQPAVELQDLISGTWQQRTPQACSGQSWWLSSTGLAALESFEGRLCESPAATAGDGTVVVVHDPWRPLPGRGGHLGLDAGPAERSDLDARSDVACFSTEPLTQPLELLGEPLLVLPASADQPGFDLCAALSRLSPEGRVEQLSTGVLRTLGEASLERQPRRIRLQPLLATLRPGDRLRLSIGLAAWPQIAVNPGSGAMPQGGAGPGHRVITVELALNEARLCINPMVGAN